MAFELNDFLDAEYNEPTSTKPVPIPENDYKAIVDGINPVTDASNRVRVFDRDDGTRWCIVNVVWELQDDGSVEKVTNRKKNTVRQPLFLDLDDNGRPDMRPGVNIALGKLREAVGMNGPGFTLNKLRGQGAIVKVVNRPDKRDESGQTMQSEVAAVASLGEGFGGSGASSSTSSPTRRKRGESAESA